MQHQKPAAPVVHHKPQPQQRNVSLSTLIMAIGLVLVVGFIAGTRSQGLFSFVNRTFGTTLNSGAELDLSAAQQAYRMVKDHYDGTIDEAKLADGAAHGVTDAAGDPHTVYFNADEADEYAKELSGSLTGIGAEIGVRNDQPTILRTITDSPAEKAGLLKGDVITMIDDTSADGFTAIEAAQLIRGDADTEVKVVVMRDGESKTFTITRAEVTDPSVSSRLEGTTGIIVLRRFDMDTGEQARIAARSLIAQGAKSFILDLRDNGGGYLSQAQSVAGLWLSNQVVVSERRNGTQTAELYSTGEAVLKGMPTVVLLNGGSASASEVVAGALKDHKVATLIGEKSFGKGTVQEIFNLTGGAKIKITIAHWFTPNGDTIDKTGITPDQTVELTSDQMNKGQDTQLDAALEKLQ